MSIFLDIAGNYEVADAAFAAAEQEAFQNDEDTAFDRAGLARQHNDQAYFLYLFTRFEAEVNALSQALLTERLASAATWSERRVWQAWSRGGIRDIPFLSKAEILTDKGREDYATIREYYDGRNMIAHGGAWQAEFVVLDIARSMNELLARCATG